MRVLYLVVFIFPIFLSSCSSKLVEYEIIKVLNHYEQNEKNIQLGRDLLYYNYIPGLKNLIDGFNEEVAKKIRWEYFIKKSNQEVSFRIKINLKNRVIVKNRRKIIDYFKKEVEKNYQFHIKNEALFSQAVNFSQEIYSHIDKGEFEKFWSKCNALIKETNDKKEFIAKFRERESEIGSLKAREFISKQYYNQPINGENKKIFVLNFSTEYSKKKGREELSLVLSEKWEVIGIRGL